MNVDDIFWMPLPALLRAVQKLEWRLEEGLGDPLPSPAPPAGVGAPMRLAMLPLMLMMCALVLSALLVALGLSALRAEMVPLRLSAGLYIVLVLWVFGGMLRHFVREEEQREAERRARDALMREQSFALWAAWQLHEAAVQERTAAVLAMLRHRPLPVRLRSLWRQAP